jgi:hypothetical protein
MRHLKTINERFSDSDFIAVLTQAGEGCDYTIGCGIKVIDLESENFNDAMEELTSLIQEEYTGDISLSSAILYKVESKENMNLSEIYSKKEEAQNLRKDSELESKEREEYERLSKKFGNK